VQRRDRSIVLKVVPLDGQGLPDRVTRQVIDYAQKYLPGVPITVEIVADIPLTAAGKRRPVVVERAG
jgi:hypothetical protein